MLDAIKKTAEERMKKTLEALHAGLAKLRTGRAHASLLDHIRVSYYGSEVPLSQVASVTTSDARTLVITPWEKTMVQPIEKAIMTADLGLNPNTAGTVIRVPMPPLTEERRKEMIKVVKSEAEDARVGIRNARRDANNQAKELLKKKQIAEDEEKRAEDAIQKLTDKYVEEVERILTAKEKELMEI